MYFIRLEKSSQDGRHSRAIIELSTKQLEKMPSLLISGYMPEAIDNAHKVGLTRTWIVVKRSENSWLQRFIFRRSKFQIISRFEVGKAI